jgi:diaminopimelate decarboxylase
MTLVGLHVHIGSQIFDLQPYCDAIKAVLDFAVELRDAVGFELQELDLGGGWGVAYSDDAKSASVESIALTIGDALQSQIIDNQLRFLFEPGRSLVAQSAVALYTVGSVKEIAGVRTYVSVDGGMGDNIRPALYGAKYIARVANRMEDAATVRVSIAGRYCEQGDILIENVELPRMRAGDIIAVPVAGAYQLPMASNYNMIPRPPWSLCAMERRA